MSERKEFPRSNYQMLIDLEKMYNPKQKGIILNEELALIERTLNLTARSEIDLQNLRDMVVMFYTLQNTFEAMDKMSAITFAIDCRIFDCTHKQGD